MQNETMEYREDTAVKTSATEDDRLTDLVRACQDAMVSGTDADTIAGLPAPEDEESWEDALWDGHGETVILCWQDTHGCHFKNRADALKNDAECVDSLEPFVDGFARPIRARIEHLDFVPENACQSHVTITGVWVGDFEGEKIEISREPPCLDDNGHDWAADSHSQDPGSREILDLTGVDTRPYGTDDGHCGASVCKRCGVIDHWKYYHGGRLEHSYSHPDPDLARKLED